MNEFDSFPQAEYGQYVEKKLPVELTVKTDDFIRAQGFIIFAALILVTISLVDIIASFIPEEED